MITATLLNQDVIGTLRTTFAPESNTHFWEQVLKLIPHSSTNDKFYYKNIPGVFYWHLQGNKGRDSLAYCTAKLHQTSFIKQICVPSFSLMRWMSIRSCSSLTISFSPNLNSKWSHFSLSRGFLWLNPHIYHIHHPVQHIEGPSSYPSTLKYGRIVYDKCFFSLPHWFSYFPIITFNITLPHHRDFHQMAHNVSLEQTL